MKTWILIAASTCAAMYVYDSFTQSFNLARSFRNRPKHQGRSRAPYVDRFAKYLSEEVELACGSGTNAGLILWTEADINSKLMSHLSDQAKSSLIKRFRRAFPKELLEEEPYQDGVAISSWLRATLQLG